MAHIIDVLSKYFVSKKIMIGLLIFIIFVLVMVWWMKRGKSSNTFDDVANSLNRDNSNNNNSNNPEIQSALNSGKEAIIYFFYADWCPHCKEVKPEWTSFETTHHDKVINGYVIKCRSIDCTKETADAANMMKRFDVDSFPTVKMEKDNTIIDYDSKVTSTALNSFVDIMLV